MHLPVVLHIPHSSTEIPKEYRSAILLTDRELQTELLRMTDWFTDELFHADTDDVTAVRYPVSRLILDPERFEDDAQEEMAGRGMGLVYLRTSDGRTLRELPTDALRKELIERYYRPHHAKLSEATTEILSQAGRALVIDCHSFASRALPYERDQGANRPDICIGTDDFHSPDWLKNVAKEVFLQSGFSVDINRPYSGALVPGQYLNSEKRVSALMIELNRGLYMDETTGSKSPRFEEIRRTIRSVLRAIIESYVEHGAAQ